MPMRVEIPKPNSSDIRPLTIPFSAERVKQTALMMISSPYVETIWKEQSVGFRYLRNRITSHICLLDEAIEKYGLGNFEFLTADLKKYYDFIPHDNIIRVIKDLPIGKGAKKFLINTMRAPILKKSSRNEWEVIIPHIGTPQGSVISPLLANHNMHNFDKLSIQEGIVFRRFADNIDLVRPLDNSQGTREEFIKLIESHIPSGTTMHPTTRPDKTQWITSDVDRRTLGIYLNPMVPQVDCVMAYGLEEEPNPIDAKKLKFKYVKYNQTLESCRKLYNVQRPPANPTEVYEWTSQRNENIISIRILWNKHIIPKGPNASRLLETQSIQNMMRHMYDNKYQLPPLRRYLNTSYTRYLNKDADEKFKQYVIEKVKSEVIPILTDTQENEKYTQTEKYIINPNYVHKFEVIPHTEKPISKYIDNPDIEYLITPDLLPKYLWYNGIKCEINSEHPVPELNREGFDKYDNPIYTSVPTIGWNGVEYCKRSYFRKIEKDERTYDRIYQGYSTTYKQRLNQFLKEEIAIDLLNYIAELNAEFNENRSRFFNNRGGKIESTMIRDNIESLERFLRNAAKYDKYIYDKYKEFIQPRLTPGKLEFLDIPTMTKVAEVQIPLGRSDSRFVKGYDYRLCIDFYPYPEFIRKTSIPQPEMNIESHILHVQTEPKREITIGPNVIIGEAFIPENQFKDKPELLLESKRIDEYLSPDEKTIDIDDYAELIIREIEPYIGFAVVGQRLEKALNYIGRLLMESEHIYESRRQAQYEMINDIESEIYGIHTVICRSLDSGYPASIEFINAYHKNRGVMYKRNRKPVMQQPTATLMNAQYSIYDPLTRITY